MFQNTYAVRAGANTPEEKLSERVTRKAWLHAALATRGFTLAEVADDGSFTVSKWGLGRSCADLDAVVDFLAQIGGVL